MKEYELEDEYGTFTGTVTIIDQAEDLFEVELPKTNLRFDTIKELRTSRMELLINKHIETELVKVVVGMVGVFILTTTILLTSNNWDGIKSILGV